MLLALKWLLLLVAVREIGRRAAPRQPSAPIELEAAAGHFGACSWIQNRCHCISRKANVPKSRAFPPPRLFFVGLTIRVVTATKATKPYARITITKIL